MARVNVDVDVDIDIIDYIDELETEDLIDELSHRGWTPKQIIEIDDLRRHLCDICEVGYHTPKEELLKLISEKI